MTGERRPCPECGETVEARRVDVEGNYPGGWVRRGIQVRCGPAHDRNCRHYRPEDNAPPDLPARRGP